MNIDVLNVIISGVVGILGALGGGGIIFWRATKKTKDAEAGKATTDARLAEADLAEKILEKYEKGILARMDSGDAVRKQEFSELKTSIDKRFDAIENENSKQNSLLKDIVEFLNGDFQQFEASKGKRSTKQKTTK